MAVDGKPSSPRKQSSIVKSWLILYNVAMTAGWFVIGLKMAMYYANNKHFDGVYKFVQNLLLIFQTAAVLEIFHAATGMVRSNVSLTTMQVFSRVGLVWAVIEPVKESQLNPGVPMLLIAWTVTEIIRYLFYTFLLVGSSPYILLWLRYTLFIVLYPLGVTGELLTIYNSLGPVKESGLFSMTLPNPYNFAFNYNTVLMGLFPVYVMFFPQLYFHMFAQRKKCLYPTAKKEE